MGGFYGSINLQTLEIDLMHHPLKHGKLYNQDSKPTNIQADGFIYNLNELVNSFGSKTETAAITALYNSSPNAFPSGLRGEFTSVISTRNAIEISTNQTCSRRVFYCDHNEKVYFHYNLKLLLIELKAANFKPEENIIALRSLMSIGGVFGNSTVIKGVQLLRAGETLRVTKSGVSLKKYYDIQIKSTSLTKEKYLSQLHDLFLSTVKKQYDHPGIMGFQLLSGGLDSRMNLSLAVENGIRQQAVLCFGQTNYRDHWISKQIAEAHNLKHEFIPLEPGHYLSEIDKNIMAVDGLCFYASSAHFNYALDHSRYISPIIHTGQVGRTIFTDHSFGLWQNLSEYKALLCSSRFADSIDSEVKAEMNLYPDMDTFYLNNRLFRVINSGNWVAQKVGCIISPFSDPDIFDFAYTACPDWKIDGHLQWQYMWKYHKPIMKFAQEEFGRPVRSDAERFIGRVQNKLRNIYYKKINPTPSKLSMNPLEYWWNINPQLKETYTKYFSENIQKLDHETELRNEIQVLFNSNSLMEKILAISVVGVMKNYID